MSRFIVVTTIHPKSRAITAMERLAGWQIVLVGDRKSVAIPASARATFLSLKQQLDLPYRLAKRCPTDHYARKNIGYLHAMERGASVIFDTDDDNYPRRKWRALPFSCRRRLISRKKYVNIFNYFTPAPIWPRGFPLDEIINRGLAPLTTRAGRQVEIGIWQGLTDREPDMDAICRLLFNKPIRFAVKDEFFLSKGHFCPVNSQNSIWEQRAFPYLYLPATVSFRSTDIVRGYVAQRMLWQDGLHVGVTPATVVQRRNAHDILQDIALELPLSLRIKEIGAAIEAPRLGDDLWGNLFDIYERLVAARIVAKEEMKLLEMWCEAVVKIERAHPWNKRNS